MAMDTCRIPPEWKQPVMAFRDAVTAEQGQEVVEAIADLATTEAGLAALAKLPALVKALEQDPRHTLAVIAALVEGETPSSSATPSDSTALLAVQGRPVPSSIAGLVDRILDIGLVEPARAREVLQRALKLG